MEVIQFNDFMAGSGFKSTFHFNLDLFSMSEAYWIVGGTGAVLIGLTWLDNKGYLKVNFDLVKIAMIIIYAAIVGKFIISSSVWNLL